MLKSHSVLHQTKISKIEGFVSRISRWSRMTIEHNEISSSRSLGFKAKELYRMIKFIADFIKYNEN